MDPILTSSVRNKRVKNFLIQQVYLRSYFLLHYLLSSCTLGKQKRLRKHTWKNKKLFDNWISYVCLPIWVQHDLYKRIHKIFEKIVVYLIFAPSVVVFLFFLFPFLCGHHRLLGKFCYGSFYWKMPITLIPIKTHFEFRKTPFRAEDNWKLVRIYFLYY